MQLPLKAARRDDIANFKSFVVSQHQSRYWPDSLTNAKLSWVAKNLIFWPQFLEENLQFLQHYLNLICPYHLAKFGWLSSGDPSWAKTVKEAECIIYGRLVQTKILFSQFVN